ncbi:MAG: histidinol-phosphatase HisJ family protein [Oscillospiraceae bacterium]|nr:histidinol-phosphatase HisJ family protein [Oscillospiraceae bacterium]
MFSNYHTHTRFCDGADSPEELVLEAIRLGCPEIGFSGHSHFNEDVCSMSEAGTLAYCEEIRRLQKKYEGSIRIRLGIEQDIFSEIDRSCFEYVIGAVHYVETNGVRYAVDESRESFLQTVREVYGGDCYAFAEDYYALVGSLRERTHCDVIAHFDLITKYNEGCCLFDTEHPRYRRAADAAMERLCLSDPHRDDERTALQPLPSGQGTAAAAGSSVPCLLEINTGAMARGYRTEPYPEPRLTEKWLSMGGELILSSDCHDRRKLLCGFEEAAHWPHREIL